MKPLLLLGCAIIAETIGTTALSASAQFTKHGFTALAILSYGVAFYFLGLSLKFIPVGVAYAIWSGMGIVLIGIIGFVALGQKLDLAAILGIGLILAGVLTIHLFSKSMAH